MLSVKLLVLLLLSWVDGQSVSEPVSHLTPPQLQPLVRLPRNDSSASASSNEPVQHEARNMAWAAPAVSLRDCNPCGRVPWVPLARSLHTPQYALSIPAIQLTLPVNYGIPMSPVNTPQKQYDAPHQPQNYGPTLPQYGPPPQSYGSPPSGPAVDDTKGNFPSQSQYNSQDDEKHGLPPPPLPQRFLSPTYGPPQPQTQFASSTNVNPTTASVVHTRSPLPPPNHQLLPSVGFNQPFNQKLLDSKPLANHQPLAKNPGNNPLPNSMIHSPPQNGIRPINQQYRGEFEKFLHNPIPFPAMSKTQLPPLFNYQNFNDGKQNHLHAYLQPPKPQNVVFTIAETDDSCRKCQEQNQLKDSEPAQAEQVSESVTKTTDKVKDNQEQKFNRLLEQTQKPLEQEKSSVQIVKSIPLAEYLSSVEYPMQIIQAPILDVPDLSKYFNLGYSNFPQVQRFQGNPFKYNHKMPLNYNQPILHSSHFINQGSPSSINTPFEQTSSTASLDNVKISDEQTTNSIPFNHKLVSNGLENHKTTESPISQSTPFHKGPTTKPSQIYHITKSRPITDTSKQTTAEHVSSSTSGHYVTSQPVTSGGFISTTPMPLLEPVHSSSQNHQSTITTGSGLSPSELSSLRYQNNEHLRDWTYARGWGNTPPQPFVSPTVPSHRARFSVRPTPATSKKSKHIHQIIVPYTTNKQASLAVQEPANSLNWTPIPPTNQGRKVPPNFNFGDQLSSTTGLEQPNYHQNAYSPENPPLEPNLAPTSSGSDTQGQRTIFPTNQGQPLNLPPQVINHILHLNQQGTLWPTGPEGLQQLLVTNLQSLLRGEEDSVDIARLQKNIDNWTAEGYKQNAPSVNFVPVTTIPHIFHSKKIPDEYLTPTEPTLTNFSQSRYPQHNFDSDHEVAESQKLQIKVHPLSHVKNDERPEEGSMSIESLLNGWSLLDTKVTSPTPSTEEATTPKPTSSEPTSKAWEKIQVSISPLTNEKVYVVTPMSVTDSEPEESSKTLLSSRVERSYSVVSAGKVLESSAPEQS